MNIEELENAERAAWKRYETVRDTHQPIIDNAVREWSDASIAVYKEKQRSLMIAKIKAELEAGNAK